MDPRPEWKDWARLHLNTTPLDIPSEISTVGHVQLEEEWGSAAAASSAGMSGTEAAGDESQILLPPPVENGDWQILNPLPQ